MADIYIKFSDGYLLTDIEMNGTTFVVPENPDINYEMLTMHPLDNIEIGIDGLTIKHELVGISLIDSEGPGFWFSLTPFSKNEIVLNKTRADVEFLAMMQDIEI